MNELALFAGAGGGILGGHLLGWRTVCAVEINPYCREVLKARQDDKALKPFPIWDDVCTFDGLPWRGCVDVISGGFPCQDISIAGGGAGLAGDRSGLRPKEIIKLRDEYPELMKRALAIEKGFKPRSTTIGLGREWTWQGVLDAHDSQPQFDFGDWKAPAMGCGCTDI